jgi:hypothetical protein
MYEIVLPVLPLAIGFLLGSGIKQAVLTLYRFLFHVEQTVTKVFTTALMVRDSTILMVKETYETALMLLRNVLDGILMVKETYETGVALLRNVLDNAVMLIGNVTKELMLIFRPALEVIVVIMKTLILVLQRASELVLLLVETVSAILTSLFTLLHNFATNTTATVSDWTSWAYKGSSNTFFYTLLYLVGFYVLAQTVLLFTKRMVKKIK